MERRVVGSEETNIKNEDIEEGHRDGCCCCHHRCHRSSSLLSRRWIKSSYLLCLLEE